MLAPGATIGILGGGQLGRMLAIAAAQLGFRTHIFCPEADSPAFDVAAAHICADYADEAALAAFASGVDCVTLEFENVPVEAIAFLSQKRPIAPSAAALRVTQDRWEEKRFLRGLGLMTAPFAKVDSLADIQTAIAELGLPAILKTRRFGYDGKGQAAIRIKEDAAAAWAAIGGAPGILEGFVDFSREVSVVAARKADGTFSAFDVTENEHANHILSRSLVPARITASIAAAAREAARRVGEGLDYVGVFAVEFFVLDGDKDGLIVNEIAPRVHNSGHWTIEGALSCQFEQHIRAVAGWPLGDPTRRCRVEMLNLIGMDVQNWPVLAAEGTTKLHLYGKMQQREGRKMGHATRLLGPDP